MASNFPKLPGYVPNHDPTIVNHKKVSHVKLEQNRNGYNVDVPLYAVPKAPAANFREEKADASKSLSQTQFVNHIGGDINEQFEPTYVKLDKQVSLFILFKLCLHLNRFSASTVSLKNQLLKAVLKTSEFTLSSSTTTSKTNPS